MFENLFRNAVHHAGPTVTIHVGILDEQNGIFIEDDGPGISDDRQDTAFEYGYSSTPDQLGLGLTIVRWIVDAHGWEILVTESQFEGARFELVGIDFE